MDPLEAYARAPFAWRDETRTVYARGEGRGVVLLHELPGLTRETIDFADWLVGRGCHVAMPLLFGAPGQPAWLGNLAAPALCVRHEFNCLRDGRASPVTDWLRALCRDVHARCGGPGVGAVGMCFTGGFVLSMMLEPAVMAPVAAQPSLPFFQPQGLDIAPQSLEAAAARASAAPLLTLRFDGDGFCPAARLDRLDRAFAPVTGDRRPRIARVTVPGGGHSTLTFHYERALARGVDTRERVLAHLRRALG